ncbi:MAG: hypothetical protein DRG76_07695 [Deltaproteobacteria bacterium]|nr:MAG: hypothetical protein DRG76_07695 [Deltaproteobacteria bacterium]
MPKTKIVCTIGPASEAPEVLRALISKGLSVARLNFSHSNGAEDANSKGQFHGKTRYYSHPNAPFHG